MATSNSIYKVYPEVISAKNPQPPKLIAIKDEEQGQVYSNHISEYLLMDGPDGSHLLKMWVVRLSGVGNSIYTTTQIATTQVGVQFWGDENSGWAQIKIDGLIRWVGNTLHSQEYVEIDDLDMRNHTITVEALGQPGSPSGGSEVRIVAFGHGVVGSERYKVFLPIITKS